MNDVKQVGLLVAVFLAGIALQTLMTGAKVSAEKDGEPASTSNAQERYYELEVGELEARAAERAYADARIATFEKVRAHYKAEMDKMDLRKNFEEFDLLRQDLSDEYLDFALDLKLHAPTLFEQSDLIAYDYVAKE